MPHNAGYKFRSSDSQTSTIHLNCGGSQSREIWHGENIEGTDYLVIIQFEQGAEAGRPSIDMYKRCPEIPLSEIPLSEIPGNPVADTASEEKIAQPSRGLQIVRQRPFPHSRATRIRKAQASIKIKRAARSPAMSCSKQKCGQSIWSDQFTLTVMTSDMTGGWNGRCDQSPNTS